MKANLTNRVAVITGSTMGIGEGMAKIFAINGAQVIVTGLEDDLGIKVAEDIVSAGNKAIYIGVDVTDKGSVQNLISTVEKEFGKIDILVNNAGYNIPLEDRGPIHQFPDDMWDKILAVDLTGVYYCSKAALQNMTKNGYGRIVNISSIVGAVPLRDQCAFAAAKAGVIQLTKAMAIELAPFGITVNAILPGSIRIPRMDDDGGLYHSGLFKSIMSHIPMGRPGTPEDISYGALYLASEEVSYTTGAILTIDGGWTSGFARDW